MTTQIKYDSSLREIQFTNDCEGPANLVLECSTKGLQKSVKKNMCYYMSLKFDNPSARQLYSIEDETLLMIKDKMEEKASLKWVENKNLTIFPDMDNLFLILDSDGEEVDHTALQQPCKLRVQIQLDGVYMRGKKEKLFGVNYEVVVIKILGRSSRKDVTNILV
jgi:hypothetical protein